MDTIFHDNNTNYILNQTVYQITLQMSKEPERERIVDHVILSQQNQPNKNISTRVYVQDEYQNRTKKIIQEHIIQEEEIIKVPNKKKKKSTKGQTKKRAKTLDSRGQLTRAQLLGGIVDKIKQVKNPHRVSTNNEQLSITENIDKIEYLIKETNQQKNIRNAEKEKEDEILKELIKQIGQISRQIHQREEIAPKKTSVIGSLSSRNTQTYPQTTKSQSNTKFPSKPGVTCSIPPQEEKLIISPKYAFSPQKQTAPFSVSGVSKPLEEKSVPIQKLTRQVKPLIKETYYGIRPMRESQISTQNQKTNSASKVKFSYAPPRYQNSSPYKPVLYTKLPQFSKPKPKQDLYVPEKKDKIEPRYHEYGCCWKCGRGCACQRIKIQK